MTDENKLIPTDEPGQQPTPDADATVETEAAGAQTALAQIGAALLASGVSASREQIDRAFTRDKMDVDIGYEEGLRTTLLMNFQSMAVLANTLNHVTGIKSLNNEDAQHRRASNAQNNDNVQNSDSNFHSGLLKAYGLETDNEVLSTVALAKVVQALANDVAGIKDAIAQAGK